MKNQRVSDTWELFNIFTGRTNTEPKTETFSSVMDAWMSVKDEAAGLDLEQAKKFVARAPVLQAEAELWQAWCQNASRLERITLRRLVNSIKDIHPDCQYIICVAWAALHSIPSYSRSDGQYAQRYLAPRALQHLIQVADNQRRLASGQGLLRDTR